MQYKAFIHHDGALGDLLLSLPAIDLIKDNKFIHIAARQDVGEFLFRVGFVNQTSSPGSSLYLSLYNDDDMDDKLRNFLLQFSESLIFSINSPSVIASKIRKIMPTYEIKTIPVESRKINIAHFRLGQLKSQYNISIPNNIFSYDYAKNLLNIPEHYLGDAKKILFNSGYDNERLLFAIHPGSGGARKCWQIENYFQIVERLLKYKGVFFIFLSGYAEEKFIKDKIDKFIEGRRNVIHISDAELTMVAAFLSLCHLYLGNDSGVSHLAALFCKKVVVIFGITEASLWKPPYDNVKVIQPDEQYYLIKNDCIQRISVDRVFNEVVNIM